MKVPDVRYDKISRRDCFVWKNVRCVSFSISSWLSGGDLESNLGTKIRGHLKVKIFFLMEPTIFESGIEKSGKFCVQTYHFVIKNNFINSGFNVLNKCSCLMRYL